MKHFTFCSSCIRRSLPAVPKPVAIVCLFVLIALTSPALGQPIVPPYSSSFNTVGEQSGWSSTGDFALSSSFTKLGGPHTGMSWVTNPGPAGSHYSVNLLSTVGSPAFDLSGMANVYISFYHNINTEPSWDRSLFQYSTDLGVTWSVVGVLNDPNGINWYNTFLYKNACGDASCFDSAHSFGIPRCPGWTSNGDCSGADAPTGPDGWVFAQIHFNAVAGRPNVRFRYAAFSDGADAHDGWAMDDFSIGSTGASFPGGTIQGNVFRDLNGDGANSGEPAEIGLKVYLYYFGVLKDSTVTDGAGHYLFSGSKIDIPGNYGVQVVAQGFAFTTANPANLSNPADGTPASNQTQNFGTFQGSISGTKWNDINDNGVKDPGEPGLGGWTFELRRDSCQGPILQTATSDPAGNYFFPVVPGAYYVTEVLQSNWRKTFPPGNCSAITTSGASSSGTANPSGVNFGNFEMGCLRVQQTVDLNGNGIVDPGDITGLPIGVICVVRTFLNGGGSPVFIDTLGNGVIGIIHCSLNEGTYASSQTFLSPGWTQTFGIAGHTFVLSGSSQKDTARFMNFKMPFASGAKFNDHNGNGIKDAGDEPIAGLMISISGTMYGNPASLTDSNGNYAIDSIGGGSHVLSEVIASGCGGYSVTKPGTNGGTYPFSGTSANVPGANQTGKDFGNFKNAKITAVAYYDDNHDGHRDAGEEGVAGWQISASGTGGGTQGTDSNGTTSFCVGPQNHTVTEAARSGWVQTEGSGGHSITPSGDEKDTVYFGGYLQDEIRSSVTGMKFLDLNENHTKDTSEYGIRNWKIILIHSGGGIPETTVTDASGNYQFTNLARGYYEVHEVAQPNFTQTYPASNFYTIHVDGSGAPVAGLDFGNYTLVTTATADSLALEVVSTHHPDGKGFRFQVPPDNAPGNAAMSVNAADNLLPAGTVVYAFDSSVVYQLDKPKYFYWIDLAGGLKYGHPCRYYFVDKAREVDSVDTEWWPVIALPSHAPLKKWNTWEDRMTSPDLFYGNYQGGGSLTATPLAAVKSTAGRTRVATTTTLDGTCALLIGGKGSSVEQACFQHDIDSVYVTLTGGNPPAVDPSKILEQNNASPAQLVSMLNQLALCETLYFYYSGFGSSAGGGGIVLDDPFDLTLPDSALASKFFNQTNLKRLNALFDASYAGYVITHNVFLRNRTPVVNVVASNSFSRNSKDGMPADTNSTYTKAWRSISKTVSPIPPNWRPINQSVRSNFNDITVYQDPQDSSNAPYFSSSMDSIPFGPVFVGASQSTDVSISNLGWIDLKIESIVSSDPDNFSVTGSDTGTIERHTPPMDFTVAFHPTSGGAKTANLLFYYNGDGSPVLMPVSGAGIPVADTTLYRTFVQESLDVKKSVKKKPYATKFSSLFINRTGAPQDSLEIRFSMPVDNISSDEFPDKLQIDSDEWLFTGSSINAGDSVNVRGIGNRAKIVKIKKWRWGLGGKDSTIIPPFMIPPAQQQFILPMPNAGNVSDQIFAALHLHGKNFLLGIARTDTPASYGWIAIKASMKLSKFFVQRGRSRPLDTLASAPRFKKFTRQLSNPDSSKYSNHLCGELAALKLGSLASALGITQGGLGQLIYDDGDINNPLNALTLNEIAARADTALTNWRLINKPSSYYEYLDSTISRTNRAFCGRIDTVSFGPALVLTGVTRPLDVPFIHGSPLNSPKLGSPFAHIGTLPEDFNLEQNYPNPFNPTTTIEFTLAEQAFVTLKVYDVLGREVTTLLNHQPMEDGTQQLIFNASRLTSGVYLYRLIAETIDDDGNPTGQKSVRVKKMVLLK